MKGHKKVPFGFDNVTPEAKDQKVLDVFNRVAGKYDLMNDLMSGGIHRLWKRHLIQMIRTRPGMHLLDVAGGTGDIAFRFLDEANAFVTVCDINQEMLTVGQSRAKKRDLHHNINWVCGNAETLAFPNNTFDAYTISFGLRNVTNPQAALNEAFRVLKPGSQFLCLEFSKVTVPLLDQIYNKYSFSLIPTLGQIVANDRDAYQYLVESIARFPNQETLQDVVSKAGFTRANYRNLTGGIAAIHEGWKI